MRKLILTAAMAAVTVPLAVQPASAQRGTRAEIRQEQRECERELRRSDNRREYRRELAECRREINQARRDWRNYRRYDYNRYEPGRGAYYADDYYRDGRYYRERRLTRNDRIYRGRDGRYYCRRSDGTTGLIVGAAVGGLLGNALNTGRSATFETILGAGAGALLGRELTRGSVRCR